MESRLIIQPSTALDWLPTTVDTLSYRFVTEYQAHDVTNSTLAPPTSRFVYFLTTFATPFLFGLISLVGLVGNSLVIYVIISNKKMRTVTNLLLLNLAFADLSFVLVVPPFTAYQQVSQSDCR